MAPKLCQGGGLLGRILTGGGVLALTNGKVSAMQTSDKGDSKRRGQEEETRETAGDR